MLPRYGPQPHKVVRQRLPGLLGHVGWFSAQCRVDQDEVAWSCWGLEHVGGQRVRDVALATPPTQEVVQHTAGQDDVSGDVRVQLHVAKEAAESVRHHAEHVFADAKRSAESVVVNHLPLLNIVTAVWTLQLLGQGERPVIYDHVGALHIGAWKFTGRWYMGNTLLHALVQSAVPPDPPISVVPALPGVDIYEFQVCVD